MTPPLNAGPVKRILIVEDHPMMREGLKVRISDEPDLQVCGESDDVANALRMVETTNPDLVIVDIALKTGSGIDLIRDIKSRHPDVKMLVLSAYPESLYAERSLRAGAMGYLDKQQTRAEILTAIRTVLAGDCYVAPQTAQRLISKAVGTQQPLDSSPLETLSDRELQVYQLIGEGLATAEIAQRLHLSPHTIDSHREKIKIKLGFRSIDELRREAVRWVFRNESR